MQLLVELIQGYSLPEKDLRLVSSSSSRSPPTLVFQTQKLLYRILIELLALIHIVFLSFLLFIIFTNIFFTTNSCQFIAKPTARLLCTSAIPPIKPPMAHQSQYPHQERHYQLSPSRPPQHLQIHHQRPPQWMQQFLLWLVFVFVHLIIFHHTQDLALQHRVLHRQEYEHPQLITKLGQSTKSSITAHFQSSSISLLCLLDGGPPRRAPLLQS